MPPIELVAGFLWGIVSGASVMFFMAYRKVIEPQLRARRQMDEMFQVLRDDEQMQDMMAAMEGAIDIEEDERDE